MFNNRIYKAHQRLKKKLSTKPNEVDIEKNRLSIKIDFGYGFTAHVMFGKSVYL